ncbi:MAG: hypothetical protein KDB03_06365 [Planctomycetales bacterium]|nr:hypothetical protein [Planctomycetales bacterium]
MQFGFDVQIGTNNAIGPRATKRVYLHEGDLYLLMEGVLMLSLRELEPAVWSELQFWACELGDKRRTDRLVKYARQMAEKRDASTPCQTESWADCKAANNMFKQSEVTFKSVMEVHYQRTRELDRGTYLVLSDLTELTYGYKSQRKGLGRLTAKHHRGFFLHSALVVRAGDSEVIGLGAQELFTRSLQKQKRVHRVNGWKRSNEAEVWGRVIDAVGSPEDGVHMIQVGDRGADNFDVFAHAVYQHTGWVIRAAQLTRKLRQTDGTIAKLGELLDVSPLFGSYQVHIAADRKQKARWATEDVRVTKATLLRPRECSTAFVMDHEIREIETNVVEVREAEPPRGCTAVRWVLYTSEPATTFKSTVFSNHSIACCMVLPATSDTYVCRRRLATSISAELGYGVALCQRLELLKLTSS